MKRILGKGILHIIDVETGKVISSSNCNSMSFETTDKEIRCELCGNVDCTCSDFDIDPDMCDRG